MTFRRSASSDQIAEACEPLAQFGDVSFRHVTSVVEIRAMVPAGAREDAPMACFLICSAQFSTKIRAYVKDSQQNWQRD